VPNIVPDEGNDAYYNVLFREDPVYSTPYPNLEESRRWARMGEILSGIAARNPRAAQEGLRILDVGCGRGWMTRLASVYGRCDGIDPVGGVIDYARSLFPEQTFIHGTLDELVRSPEFAPYDAILCSEVLEHVVDKDAFAALLHRCTRPGGHVILTTPRGELYARYRSSGYDEQPVEAWITERQLEALFARHGFRRALHDRVHDDLPKLSFLHRVAASRSLEARLDGIGLRWIVKGLQHVTAIYQVWCFERHPG